MNLPVAWWLKENPSADQELNTLTFSQICSLACEQSSVILLSWWGKTCLNSDYEKKYYILVFFPGIVNERACKMIKLAMW